MPRATATATAQAAAVTAVAHGGDRQHERATMVREQLVGRDIVDPSVLAAMATVPRHRFVPPELTRFAYEDRPLTIGHDATISQPYIVALILQLARIRPGARVLDVGTGSGYQAAVAAEIGAVVAGIERFPALAVESSARLAELGYDVDVVQGDGWKGRPELGLFDAILVAAAAAEIPAALEEQLAPGGHLVIPVGERWSQQLRVITRDERGIEQRTIAAVSFVPLVRSD